MPSYDKEKLLRMMQERHIGFLAVRDLRDRQRNVRMQIESMKRRIRECAASMGANDHAEGLLHLSLADAAALTTEAVESYVQVQHRSSGVIEQKFQSGIGYAMWTEFNHLRERYERQENEVGRIQASADERYAILPGLMEAVRRWGFSDPEKEM